MWKENVHCPEAQSGSDRFQSLNLPIHLITRVKLTGYWKSILMFSSQVLHVGRSRTARFRQNARCEGRKWPHPYEISFERTQSLADIAYELPSRIFQDSSECFWKMQFIDEKMARSSNDIYQKHALCMNDYRREKKVFQIGDRVWYRRPQCAGGKLDTRWIGAALVMKRKEAQSYVVQVKPGFEINALENFSSHTARKDF